MGVFTRPDSPFFWIWLEGAPPGTPKINTKIPIGKTPALRKANRELAEQVYSALMGDLARDRFRLPHTREPRTFLEQRTWYAAHVSVKKRGLTRELSMLKQLGAFFDDYELAAIDRQLREEWRTWRAEDVSASTINREDELLKHMLSLAVGKYIDANPIGGAARLRPNDVETRILTRDEEQRLLETARRTPLDYAAVLCGLDGLMRRGSVATLKRAQDHGRFLTLLNAKAGTYKVPVSRRLRQALDAIDAGDGLLARYFAAYGARVDQAISRMFAALCARADVSAGRAQNGVTFHSLRHTGASRMLEAGVDIKTVMRIGGWRNLKTLERYLHPTDAAAQRAVNTIAAPVPFPIGKRRAKNRRKSA